MLGPCAVFVLSNNIIADCIGLSRIGCLGQRVRIGLIKDKLFEDLGITGRIVRVDEVLCMRILSARNISVYLLVKEREKRYQLQRNGYKKAERS